MPWAMSAPTVASAVVMRTAASPGVGLECFALLMMLELRNGRVCRSAARCRGLRRGSWVSQRRVSMKFEPVPGRGALMEERVERTRIEDDYDEEFHHRREPRGPWRDRSRFARVREDCELPTGHHGRARPSPCRARHTANRMAA